MYEPDFIGGVKEYVGLWSITVTQRKTLNVLLRSMPGGTEDINLEGDTEVLADDGAETVVSDVEEMMFLDSVFHWSARMVKPSAKVIYESLEINAKA